MKILVLFWTLSHLGLSAYGQQKFERESRISTKDVPRLAVEFILEMQPMGKVKWYSETGLNGKTVEAKFKEEGKRFSIEFDTSGSILDAEIEINCNDLSTPVKKAINAQLAEVCLSFKFSKMQIQYSGEREQLLAYLKDGTGLEGLTIRYEVVAKCVEQKETNLIECLFGYDGKLLKKSEIIFNNSSNLEY